MKKITRGDKPRAQEKNTYDAQELADKKNGKGTEAAKKKRRTPVLVGAIILVVLIVVAVVVGGYILIDSINYVSTDDASISGDRVNLAAKVLGRIKSVLVNEGDTVSAGQPLILLDDADLRAQETQAAASLNYAKQNIVLARVNLERAQEDYTRAKTLFDAGAATRENYDHALKALDSAQAQYSIAQAQIETSQAQLGVIETQLLNTKITAPINGTIAKQNLMVGDIVQPGQNIFTINNLKSVWVTANFEETKIHRIKTGAAVIVTVDAWPGREFKGTVAQIAAGIVTPSFSIGEFTKTTQRVPVKILLVDIPEGVTLLPGMSVEVKIQTR
jgi:membrane fusion protein (multidrug efflux system)